MSDARRVIGVQESEYRAFVESAQHALRSSPAVDVAATQLEVSGSLARGELSPPYSDLDLALIAPAGAGANVRDHVPALARSVGRELLAIFVDPLNPLAVFCSVYRGPFKVDWWVFEETADSRRTAIWRGNAPPPYEWASHCWDWLWWLWGKARRGKDDLVKQDLPRLWQFLTIKGVDPRQLPPTLPESTPHEDLLALLRQTMNLLPAPDAALGHEIRFAIDRDSG